MNRKMIADILGLGYARATQIINMALGGERVNTFTPEDIDRIKNFYADFLSKSRKKKPGTSVIFFRIKNELEEIIRKDAEKEGLRRQDKLRQIIEDYYKDKLIL